MAKPKKRADRSEQFTGALAEPIELPGIPITGVNIDQLADLRLRARLGAQIDKLPLLAKHYGFDDFTPGVVLPLLFRLAEDFVPGFRSFTPPHEKARDLMPAGRGGRSRRTRQDVERYSVLANALRTAGFASDHAAMELILTAEHAAAHGIEIAKVSRQTRRELRKNAKTLTNVVSANRASQRKKSR